jgi:hypothetical protein
MNPKAILNVAKTKAFIDNFMNFIRRMKKKGKTGSYLFRFKKVLDSWFPCNGLNVKLNRSDPKVILKIAKTKAFRTTS